MQPHPSPRGLRDQLNTGIKQPGSTTGWTDYRGLASSDGQPADLVHFRFPLPTGGGNGELSENRRRAVEYADKYAESYNSRYEDFGEYKDCTNFASQVMRAGGFADVGNGIGDWHHGDSDDWYYQDTGEHFPGNLQSATWSLARENHNFITQHSHRGDITGIAKLDTREQLDLLAPSRAGLIPGDLIYYKNAEGTINHVAVYVGQQVQDGQLVDVVDQHARLPNDSRNYHNDWVPESRDYYGGSAQVEFVRLRYPGE